MEEFCCLFMPRIFRCAIKASSPNKIAEAAAIPSVVGPMAAEREYLGEEAMAYMEARKPNTEQAKLGMKMASSRKRREGQANQRRTERLYPPVRRATNIIASTPLPKRS
jgi:hypothetical protein